MKREIERVKRLPTSDRETMELRNLRDELERFKKRPTTLDDNTRRKLDEYEDKLRAENTRFRELEGAFNSLARKSNMDEQELNRIKRSIETADERAPFDEVARRRIREM